MQNPVVGKLISVSDAARRLSASRSGVHRLIEAGFLGARDLPNCPVKVSEFDVEKLAQLSYRPAKASRPR